ncbi:MAG: hypothetical protein AB7S57_00215 [Acetobacteraceae bacterium]
MDMTSISPYVRTDAKLRDRALATSSICRVAVVALALGAAALGAAPPAMAQSRNQNQYQPQYQDQGQYQNRADDDSWFSMSGPGDRGWLWTEGDQQAQRGQQAQRSQQQYSNRSDDDWLGLSGPGDRGPMWAERDQYGQQQYDRGYRMGQDDARRGTNSPNSQRPDYAQGQARSGWHNDYDRGTGYYNQGIYYPDAGGQRNYSQRNYGQRNYSQGNYDSALGYLQRADQMMDRGSYRDAWIALGRAETRLLTRAGAPNQGNEGATGGAVGAIRDARQALKDRDFAYAQERTERAIALADRGYAIGSYVQGNELTPAGRRGPDSPLTYGGRSTTAER